MKKEWITENTEETEAVGAEIAAMLRAGDFVAMFGDLGAGKTALVRGAAHLLCPTARVQSPTYTIVNEYPGTPPVYHFDLYRITDGDSLYATGFYDYTESGGICFAEWSENILPWLPENYYSLTLEKLDVDRRRITLRRVGDENDNNK